MLVVRVLPLLLTALIAAAQDQAPIVYDQIHNFTTIDGTWASGVGNVVTGPGFANPVNYSFTYPATTGISYSFTKDGFFEQAEYRFNGNGSQPSCIQGVVLFQHGQYTLQPNGSITMEPFAADGRIQVEDTCAAKSNVIMQFNTSILIQSWRIFNDPTAGPKLHLFRFDGAPYTPMFLISKKPIMLPTQVLTVQNNTQQLNVLLSAASSPHPESNTRLWTVLAMGLLTALLAIVL